MTSFLYVALAVMIFTIVAIFTTTLRDKRRAQQLAEAAPKFGFSFAVDGTNLLAEGLADLPLFLISQLPRQSEIRNVLRKPLTEGDLILCDYHYWTGGNSKTRFDHDQTVACFRLSRPTFPEFTLRQRPSNREREMLRMGLGFASLPSRMGSSSFRHALDRMVGSLEDEGIQWSAHPNFNQRYWLKAPEHADETRALFSGELIEFLEPRTSPLCIESAGRWLAIYRKDTKVKPDDIGTFSGEAERVLQILLKAHEGAGKT
jgi:hypothetical protein